MRITASQLRRIIKEEVALVNEASDLGAALSAGSLAGVGRASIVTALSALSDEDFKKLELAMRVAVNRRAETKRSGKVAGMASKFTPVSIAKKINSSLSSYNWSWAGEYDSDARDAVYSVVSAALGPEAIRKFENALMYINGSDADVYRKMSKSEADRAYRKAQDDLARIAGDLEMA